MVSWSEKLRWWKIPILSTRLDCQQIRSNKKYHQALQVKSGTHNNYQKIINISKIYSKICGNSKRTSTIMLPTISRITHLTKCTTDLSYHSHFIHAYFRALKNMQGAKVLELSRTKLVKLNWLLGMGVSELQCPWKYSSKFLRLHKFADLVISAVKFNSFKTKQKF